MIKVDIISGFLGAGKTTFIRKILKEALVGQKVALIENEFGEIGIDGGFLKEAGIQIREMNSGCICCSLAGDFEQSLKEVIETYKPDRVMIEPSGVGKLSDVINAVMRMAEDAGLVLNSAVTVVDAGKCKMYMKNFGEFFNNQIEHAGTIILSRTDTTAAEKVKAGVTLIREHNQEALIVTTPCNQLTGEQLLHIMEERDHMEAQLIQSVRQSHSQYHDESCECGEAHGHHHSGEKCGCGGDHGHHHCNGGCSCGGSHEYHHAEEVFASWGMEHVEEIGKERLEEILDELAYGSKYGDVLRAKGMLAGADGEWYYFDLVPEEVEIRKGIPEYTAKVCVIGANLNKKELEKAFGRG